MKPTGYIAGVPVFVFTALTPSGRGGGIAHELADRASKAKAEGAADVAVVLTPAELAALKAERAELEGQHAKRVTRAVEKGLPEPEALPQALYCDAGELPESVPEAPQAEAPDEDAGLAALAAELAALPE
jgi:hypothetical protein